MSGTELGADSGRDRQAIDAATAAGHDATPAIHDAPATARHIGNLIVRSFRYPGGRLWTVWQVQHPDGGGPPVLRFTAGIRSVDLKAWPSDWVDAPDARLAELLRSAMPRPAQPARPDAPRRRATDH
jgi:hypothetical protein